MRFISLLLRPEHTTIRVCAEKIAMIESNEDGHAIVTFDNGQRILVLESEKEIISKIQQAVEL